MIFGMQDIMITHRMTGKVIGQEQAKNSACGSIPKAKTLRQFPEI